ncbi:MAG: hypothetical protein U1F68_16185 [Gammaproteobacteria bacterium]
MNIRHSVLCLLLLTPALAAQADDKAQKQTQGPDAIEVTLDAGTADNQNKFVPDKLQFERGKLYKLIIHNPSNTDHYFSADGLGTHVFSRKVEAYDRDGKTLAEIHGQMYDFEIKAGSTIAWYFYPMTKGKHLKFLCHKEGHEEGGMVGEVEISGPPPFSK